MRTARLALALVPLLAACLEKEEELVVRPDGSVTVTLSAQGDLADLADGYPVPLQVPWRPLGEDTLWWLAELGPETDGPFVQARLGEATRHWEAAQGGRDPRLSVQRDFARVEDLPRWTAPEGEPYRTAFLERRTSLRILEKGERTVYVFERVFPARPHARLDALMTGYDALPEELRDRLEHDEPLTPADWPVIVSTLAGAHADAAETHVRSALVRLYVDGDASLSPGAVEGVVAAVRADVVALLDRTRLQRVYAWAQAEAQDEDDPDGLLRLEQDFRATVRGVLARFLDGERVPERTRNAALSALEWSFTALDQTDDLGDEKLRVRVSLPGVVVDGNQDGVEDGFLVWELEGDAFRDRDVVLRAVSVLE